MLSNSINLELDKKTFAPGAVTQQRSWTKRTVLSKGDVLTITISFIGQRSVILHSILSVSPLIGIQQGLNAELGIMARS